MRLRSKTELAALTALAYGPYLLSAPGRVSADSKQDLYLDPGRFLARAASLWDPHVGAGTVPHQNLGYLFPTGPWFWAFDRLGVPDWVAQRLWWGTIALVAVLGARWLFQQLGTGRTGALVGALVYMLTPYQLAFTARISVLLLPWAALPWLVGLTMRATRSGGWRPPALVAVALLLAGGINASSLLFVAIGPALWVALELLSRTEARRAVVAAGGRLALLAVGVCLWWMVGIRLQASHGLPVLQLTENLRTVADASTPGDVLRGLGNWFFYGHDQRGYSLDQAKAYADDDLVVLLSYLVPVLALMAAVLVRWAHRAYFGLLVVVGAVVSVGAWPIDDPTPYGALWKRFASDTSVGLAFRNSPRAVPLVVLGLAGLLAAGVSALPPVRWRSVGAGTVALAALGGLLPVWQTGYLSDGLTRPEDIPRYWREAAASLDAGDHATRVLEIPGSSFAAYRWGTTIDPVTPALIRRPYLAREVLPQGSAPSANLLAAFDRRLQLGIFEPAAVPAVARLFGAGTVVLRADLEQRGRFDTPAPYGLWHDLTSPVPDGLRPPSTFGPPGGDGSDPEMPSVAIFEVADARPIVRTAPVAGPVVLAGDGDGVVDAASAGLIDGRSLLLSAPALDQGALQGALEAGAHIVLTDTYRRRSETWFYSLRDTRGPTEQAGQTEPDPTGYDFRLDPFPGAGDASRTVVEQVGGRATSSGGGGPERPEDRAAHAVDGDIGTAWRVANADPTGQTLTIVPASAVPASEVRFVQPAIPPGGRALTRIALRIDGGAPMEVELGPASLTPAGQAVPIDGPNVHRLEVEIRATTADLSPTRPAPVGLAEVRIGSFQLAEQVRLPVDLLRRVGEDLRGHSLDIVLTRQRLSLPGADRRDDETHLDRRFELPTPRTFSLTAMAGPVPVTDPRPPIPADACRGDVLSIDGQPVPVRVRPVGEDLRVEACAPVVLGTGTHRLLAATGSVTGLDIDRIVLSSSPDDEPAPVAPRGSSDARSTATVRVRDQDATHLALTAHTDGRPFWLVLGQSSNAGWSATVAGGRASARQLVDGYANGWLITPDRAGDVQVTLRWGPQRLVWVGFAGTGLTLAAIALILLRTRARPVIGAPLAERPTLGPAWSRQPLSRAALARLAGLVVVGSAVAPPEMAAVAAGVVGLASLVPAGTLLVAAAGPGALLVSRASHRPSLAWVAVLVLAAAVLVPDRPDAERR